MPTGLYGDSYNEALAASRREVQTPAAPAGPAPFAGFLSAVIGAPGAAVHETMSALNAPFPAMQAGNADPSAVWVDQTPIDPSRVFRERAKELTPDPLTTGTASRLVFDATRVLLKAGALTAAGGPLLGAVGTGTAEGTVEAQKLRDEGVDPATAAKVGLAKGVSTGVSLALPVAGRTFAQTALYVAAGGPAAFMAEQQAAKTILENANYADKAARYDPLDPLGLTLSVVIPGLFGAGVHGARALRARAAGAGVEAPPRLPVTEEAEAAARATQLNGHIADTGLYAPDNLTAATAHLDAMNSARAALDLGRRVEVGDAIRPEDMSARGRAAVEAMRAEVGEAQVQARAFEILRAQHEPDLIATAGATDVNIADVRANLDPLNAELRALTDDRAAVIKDTARDLQAQQDMKFKDAQREATKLYEGRLADLQATAARLGDQLKASQAAELARQELGTLARGDVPARLQGDFDARTTSLRKAGQERPISAAVREALGEIEQSRAARTPAAAAKPAEVPRETPAPAEKPATGEKSQTDPVETNAREIATTAPDMRILDEAGTETTAAKLLDDAEAIYQQDVKDADGFMAAINCFIKGGA